MESTNSRTKPGFLELEWVPSFGIVSLYVCALMVRLILIGFVHWTPHDDAAQYYQLAREISDYQTYSSAFREPGYPFFLAVLYKFSGDNLRIIYQLQAGVTSLLPIVAWKLFVCLLPHSRRTAFWLAMLVGVHPELASFSGLLLRESLYCLLITWLVVLMIRGVREPSYANFVLVGLAAGLCSMVREEALLFLVIYAAYAFIRIWCTKRPPDVVLGLVSILIIIGPWIYRNSKHHDFIGLTCSTGRALPFIRVYYLDRKGTVEPEMRSLAERVIEENGFNDDDIRTCKITNAMARAIETSPDFDEARFQRSLRGISFENIRNHPVAFVADGLREFRSLFGGYSWHFAFPSWLELPRWQVAYEKRLWDVFALKVVNGVIFPLVMWMLLVASLFWRIGREDWLWIE